MEEEASHVYIRYPLSTKIECQSWHCQSPESDTDLATYVQMLDWIRQNAITQFFVRRKRLTIIQEWSGDFSWRYQALEEMVGWWYGWTFVWWPIDGMIRIHGSGGSPEIKGPFAPSLLTDSKDDPQLVLPLHQSLDNHINEALHRMVAEGSVVAVYVNEDIFLHDNGVHADGNNSCVKSKQATSPTKRQKLGHQIKKEMTSGEKYCLFLGHFWCTSYGLKRERGRQLFHCSAQRKHNRDRCTQGTDCFPM